MLLAYINTITIFHKILKFSANFLKAFLRLIQQIYKFTFLNQYIEKTFLFCVLHVLLPCIDTRCSQSTPAARSHRLGGSGPHEHRKSFFRCLRRCPDQDKKDSRHLASSPDDYKTGEDNHEASNPLHHATICKELGNEGPFECDKYLLNGAKHMHELLTRHSHSIHW